MPLAPAMDAALQGAAPTLVGLVEIELPDYNLRLLAPGTGLIAWGDKVFTGADPNFGVLAAISEISDGTGDEAPAITLTLMPSSDAAAGLLASPTMQGSPVKIWQAAVDRVSGLVYADPELLFIGELDVPTIVSGPDGRTLEYEVVSVFERLFEQDEGARLVSGFHKSIWPGELGFDFVTGVEDQIYWGVEAPKSAVSYGSSGAGGGRTTGNRYLV
ncbi:hypothetical protein [Pedomonas sp. V897]|uniref:hypothetical protein n=1 Tax=Pedomonas sp. V897 TaxID=3446482 RepID=UPI003EE1D9FD